jgi:hypothetical protein
MVCVPKVRGLLWREHPQGSQTRPVTKRRGDWWISWKCRSHHRHREKVGPRGLALEEYHRRRTQSRREGFCPRLQRRAVATLFEDLAARWLRDHARVVKRSWTSDRHRIETLKSHFGRSTLTEITPDRVDRDRSDRLTVKRKGRKRTISPTTVNKEVALLKAMLNRAIAWGLLDTNPILRVKKLREPEVESVTSSRKKSTASSRPARLISGQSWSAPCTPGCVAAKSSGSPGTAST